MIAFTRSSRTSLSRCCRAGLFFALALIGSAGCGGAAGGLELSYWPQATPIAIDATLRLPHDVRFNVALSPSSQEPGLLGTSQADSTASPAGEGLASATVTRGGKATATFQLGHAVRNDSARQVDLHVRTRYSADYSASATPDVEKAIGTLSLRFVARDGRKRLLVDRPLVQYSTDLGRTESSGSAGDATSITLGPGDAVTLFIVGHCAIDAADGESAELRMALKSLEIDVQSVAAPPVAP